VLTVSLDLWGTLAKWTDRAAAAAWRQEQFQRILTAHGHHIPTSTLDRAITAVHANTARDQRDHGRQPSGAEQIARLLTRLDIDSVSPELRAQLAEAHGTAALRDRAQLLPGAHQAITAARDRTDRLVLTSNTGATPGHVHRILLEHLGLLGLFDQLLFSDELGLAKPHPVVFRIARGPGRHLVHIGDDLATDVRGCRNADGHALWFAPDPPPGTRATNEPRLSSLAALGTQLDHLALCNLEDSRP
jgi:putative hydrolase of the HAD superfamily